MKVTKKKNTCISKSVAGGGRTESVAPGEGREPRRAAWRRGRSTPGGHQGRCSRRRRPGDRGPWCPALGADSSSLVVVVLCHCDETSPHGVIDESALLMSHQGGNSREVRVRTLRVFMVLRAIRFRNGNNQFVNFTQLYALSVRSKNHTRNILIVRHLPSLCTVHLLTWLFSTHWQQIQASKLS